MKRSKWEYKNFSSPKILWSQYDSRVCAWLNKRGAAGWELIDLQLLVHKRTGAPAQWVGLFKRAVKS